MVLPVNSLGAFTFRFWLGPTPSTISQSVQVLQHPGVDYEGFRWMGLRSGQYSRESVTDVADLEAGRTLLNQYAAAIMGGPHQLIWFGYDFDTENKRVLIESVDLVSLRQNALICYDGSSGNNWDLRVRWTFRLTPI